MSSRRGLTLAERSALAEARSGRGGARHCWISGSAQAPGSWPGLLVEWRRSEAGWQGRVLYVVTTDGRCVLVEEWLPADHLSAG